MTTHESAPEGAAAEREAFVKLLDEVVYSHLGFVQARGPSRCQASVDAVLAAYDADRAARTNATQLIDAFDAGAATHAIKPATLLRAAEILDREAECLSRSYIVSTMSSDEPIWDDANAKADHDEMIALAAELRGEVTASTSPVPSAATGDDSART